MVSRPQRNLLSFNTAGEGASACLIAADIEGVLKDAECGLIEGFSDQHQVFLDGYSAVEALGVERDWGVSLVPRVSLPTERGSRFPIETFPDSVKAYVKAASTSLDVDPAMVAVPLLSMLGGVMGNRYRIRIVDGYEMMPIIWTAVVADTGTAKSPALDKAKKPLVTLQDEAFRYPPVDGDVRHYFTTSITPEAVPEKLQGESPGMVVIRDELSGFVKAFDQYRGGGGDERQTWLSSWSGEAIKVDRRTSPTIWVKDPVICVAGGVQPERMSSIADSDSLADGFFARFLWSFPPTRARKLQRRTVDRAVEADFTRVFKKLDSFVPGELNRFKMVKLSRTATDLYEVWHNRNSDIGFTRGAPYSGVYSKLEGYCGRLMLVLHCMRYPEDPDKHAVSRRTALDAMELTEYFRFQAHAALEQLGYNPDSEISQLAVKIEATLGINQDKWMTGPDLSKTLPKRVIADKRDTALDELVASGRVERRDVPPAGSQAGGRPSRQWRWITPG